MNFGQAIEALKEGKKVAREGWNGNRKPPIISDFPVVEFDGRIFYDENTGLGYIKTSRGNIACFSGCDWDIVSAQENWTEDEKGGLFYTSYTDVKKTITLHSLIIGPLPSGYVIDHISGNRLDNRRGNLRVATSSQNSVNSKGRSGTSIYKGVSFDSSRNKWISSIQVNGKTKHIGRFENEEDAARAYDLESYNQYGEFAKLNFPNIDLPARMWLALSVGNPSLPADKFWNPHNKAFAESNGGQAEVLSTITMKTADNKILMGWLASQTDMLAEDWVIVE